MSTKFWDCIGKLHKIEHNIPPMHRTFEIFVASVGLCGRGFQFYYQILKGRCYGNEILHLRAKLHKIDNNCGPVHRRFKVFSAIVEATWSSQE